MLNKLNKFTQTQKILVGFGLLMLIVALGVGIYALFIKGNSGEEKVSASGEVILERVSNYGSNTFTVSYFTDKKVYGKVEVADNEEFNNPRTYYDMRDYDLDGKEGKQVGRNGHIVEIKELEPETRYWYKIYAGSNEKKESSYSISTTAVDDNVANPIPIFGTVLDKDGNFMPNVMIEIQAERADGVFSWPLVTYTTENGTYTADLANLRVGPLYENWALFLEKSENDAPISVNVKAYNKDEAYEYKIFDGQYEPVQTFQFKKSEGDKIGGTFESIVGSAKAEQCSNDDHCCLAAKAEGDCKAAGQNCTWQADIEARKKLCEASRKNNDKRSQDNKERDLGKKSSGRPSNDACSVLHSTYATRIKSGDNECFAGNAARAAALDAGGSPDETCGTSKSLGSEPDNCGPDERNQRSQDSTEVDRLKLGMGPNDRESRYAGELCFYDPVATTIAVKCVGREKPGYAIEAIQCDTMFLRAIGQEGGSTPRSHPDKRPYLIGTDYCGEPIRESSSKVTTPPAEPATPAQTEPPQRERPIQPATPQQPPPIAESISDQPTSVSTPYQNLPACRDLATHERQFVFTKGDPNGTPCYFFENGGGEGSWCNSGYTSNIGSDRFPVDTLCVKVDNSQQSTRYDETTGRGDTHINCQHISETSIRTSNRPISGGYLECKYPEVDRIFYICIGETPIYDISSNSCVRQNPICQGTINIDYGPLVGSQSENEALCNSGGSTYVQCLNDTKYVQDPVNGGCLTIYTVPYMPQSPSSPPQNSSTPAQNQTLSECDLRWAGYIQGDPSQCVCPAGMKKIFWQRNGEKNIKCENVPLCGDINTSTQTFGGQAYFLYRDCAIPYATSIYDYVGAFECRSDYVPRQSADGTYTCFYDDTGGRYKNSIPELPDKLITSVKAQTSEENSLGSKNITSGAILPPGSYVYNNTRFNFLAPTSILIYDDINGNGVRDEGENEVRNQILQFETVQSGFRYTFKPGWNLVNIPLVSEDGSTSYTARDLYAIFKGQGLTIDAIKKWENGSWSEYLEDDGVVFGENFNIVPNQGYFIKTSNSRSVSLLGKASAQSFPANTINGWSLVGFAPGFNANGGSIYRNPDLASGDVTAFKIIKALNAANPDLGLDNVTKWDSGIYKGVNVKEGKEFGLDFRIENTAGYFVRGRGGVIAP